MRALRRLCDEFGRTVILVVHDINFAAAYSDCIVAMQGGRPLGAHPMSRGQVQNITGDSFFAWDGDVLVVWKLDRLGRSLAHLVNTVKELSDRKIGLRVLTGKGAQIDTTTASGRMVFGIFATLAEFERDLIRERTMAGLASARARGRKGGRKFALTKAQVRLAQAAMAQRDTSVSDLCKELGIERVTLYRYVGPKGELRDHGKHVLGLTSQLVSFRKLSHLRASSEN